MRLNKYLPFFRSSLVSISAVLVAHLGAHAVAQTDAPSEAEAEAILTVGSKAPALDIETWFSDREGEFERTTTFKPGKIYLIDFWATWSPVTHPWMVNYADLQDRYVDDGLQIIRVSDEDENSVANFLELDVKGHAETIYAEWALGYCVTTDPDRSVHQDYTEAAQHANLPVVFIIGRTGHVEWLGDPARMQKPLRKIIADKWDREVFAATLLAQQRMNKMAAQVRELLQKGDTEGALKLIEQMLIDAPDSKVKSDMANLRLQILLQIDGANIAQAFQDVASAYRDNASQLNELAWSIVTREMGGKEISADLLEIAAETAERAVELARDAVGDDNRGEELLGMILDTHAHLVFLQGDLDKALELQTEASQVNGQDDILEYLDELRKEAAKRPQPQTEPQPQGNQDTNNDASEDSDSKDGASAGEGEQPPKTEEDPFDGLGTET